MVALIHLNHQALVKIELHPFLKGDHLSIFFKAFKLINGEIFNPALLVNNEDPRIGEINSLAAYMTAYLFKSTGK
jgi:hypothetical protein